MRIRFYICLVFFCFSAVSHAQTPSGFPWLMTQYKYDHLSDKQQDIYLNSFFESAGFILYSYLPHDNPDAVKTMNTWFDCVNETKDSKNKWSPWASWMSGENLDKSPAYILYNVVSPLVCEGYEERADSELRVLRIYSYDDWLDWSIKNKAVYLAGYVDTVASFQMRMRDKGVDDDLGDLLILIEAYGIEGILSDVMNVNFETQYPLPWSISRGMGAAKRRVFTD